MPYQIDEEIGIHIGVPTVRQTKLQPNGTIEARADTAGSGFSLHYRQRTHAPTVGEKLLVAVLSGVHPEWLPSGKIIADEEDEEIPRIDYRAASVEQYGSNDPSRAENIDVLRMTAVDRGDLKRLHLAMTNMSESKVHAAVVLTKRQVTSLLTALIAIYPRLHED